MAKHRIPAQRAGETDAEHVKPYSDTGNKSEQVEQMFDSIAPAYDFMNTAMTFGMHRSWRNRALSMLAGKLARQTSAGPLRMLDVACGTGDVTFRMYDRFGPEADITGIDLSQGMLDVARRKLQEMSPAHRAAIKFQAADCLKLPFADNTFDAVTVAYGVRNFERLTEGYAQMLRVLRPGGVLCVIELCEPASPLTRWGYRLYSRHIIPFIGRRVSKDDRAYSYLPQSIAACPDRDAMTRLMAQAGFIHTEWHTLFPGAVAIYLARKA